MKTLLILAALTLAILIIRQQWQRRRSPSGERTVTQATVQCAHCGLYLPAQDAIEHRGRRYCCPAHRDTDGRD